MSRFWRGTSAWNALHCCSHHLRLSRLAYDTVTAAGVTLVQEQVIVAMASAGELGLAQQHAMQASRLTCSQALRLSGLACRERHG